MFGGFISQGQGAISPKPESKRLAQLTKVFYKVCEGEKMILAPHDAKLFLEALRHRPTPTACVEILISSKAGLGGMRKAITVDLSPQFIIENVLPFLTFIRDERVKALAGGQLLRQILCQIVEPPTFWLALFKLFENRKLDDESLCPFAWLVLEILTFPPSPVLNFTAEAKKVVHHGSLEKSTLHDARALHRKIENFLRLRSGPTLMSPVGYVPGGRHDNDFADFRSIRVFPTTDEFLSNEAPYYRTAMEVASIDAKERLAVHLDNQFRVLREDMLYELREGLQIATGRKKGGRRAQILGNLILCKEVWVGEPTRPKKSSIVIACGRGMEALPPMGNGGASRKKFLQDNPWFLKHQSFGALCKGEKIISFAFIDRDQEALLDDPPLVGLQFVDEGGLGRGLTALKFPEGVQFVLVDAPVFAYQPILEGLQALTELPLGTALLDPGHPKAAEDKIRDYDAQVTLYARTLLSGQKIMSMGSKKVPLDEYQVKCILNFLRNPVSAIQGPPGTGKSFVGAQMMKHVIDYTKHTILLITYTHHALDDALGHLLDVGIPSSHMVRLGSKAKATERTEKMSLMEQSSGYRRKKTSWQVIHATKLLCTHLSGELGRRLSSLTTTTMTLEDLNDHWDFSNEYTHFSGVFDIPQDNDGFTRIGSKRKKMEPDYLFARWHGGCDAGVFKKHPIAADQRVWGLKPSERRGLVRQWREELIKAKVDEVRAVATRYDLEQNKLDRLFDDSNIEVLKSKRVIACTTTAAAKYHEIIKAAAPEVVFVEEAGEILEAHVLTALTPTVKQLCLIGDHKQLRPKVSNYGLTVEKGDGYDLNQSLFERLILQGMKHTALSRQHRSHPEISFNIRHLTYPNLEDGDKTLHLEAVRGLADRVLFVNHGKLEDAESRLNDRRDPGLKVSKKNSHEAQMVLRCVRFLVQQGYKRENIVVLTPYLGQLFVLRELLSKENDPWLNDIDSYELVRSGLMAQAAAKVGKKGLRLSTIDNYQGEECDIVIASLTRSNENGDIGFMAAPERVNVLLSRARKGLVMFGNMDTFMKSRKGTTAWANLFEIFKERGHLYDGLPVRCEQHPEKTFLLQEPRDFDRNVPDGGCDVSCGVAFSCGLHKCTRRCHRLDDHTKIGCTSLVQRQCPRGHKSKVPCRKQKEGCIACLEEDKETERRVKRDLQLEMDRSRRQKEYKKALQKVQDELDHERRKIKYRCEQEQQEEDLVRQKKELTSTKATAERVQAQAAKRASQQAQNSSASKMTTVSPRGVIPSEAREEWELMKESEHVANPPLDELMGMIGLEGVKAECLNIKSRVDIATRQDVPLTKERFSASLLGNPGTGKTTVARLYAQFLTSVGVIAGSCFEETTGAALAHSGVSGCKKLIDDMLGRGGGVLFIDEAYQLASGQNSGGAAVLDFLLPEVENLTGKVIFVLAGYNKQMEAFFAHNPGLPSRFPVTMKFADYTDDELLGIMELKLHTRYKGKMEVADGPRGLYARVVSRRIGLGRGKEGFGNARTVENTMSRITERQAVRIRKARRRREKPNDLYLTMEDIIGPEPGEALKGSKTWKSLQSLIGLDAVKEAVQTLVDTIAENYKRELREQPPIQYSLNKVFLGNPGTGKTTVAKMYGQVLADLGLLSNGEVVIKTPADFVGSALGHSEQQTKGILASAVGKVLVIDEAYGLYGGQTSDIYKTAVIDTIVAEVQSVPGDDRCVLLLGYKDQMETMFQNVNPGLSRRFPIASAFNFEDFGDDGLAKILDLKLTQVGFQATNAAKRVAMDMLSRARNRPNFGNGGEVDIILDGAKGRLQKRYSKGNAPSASLLDAVDFDPDFNRAENAATNIGLLFKGTVGCESIITKLKGYQETARTLKELEMDPRDAIPFNFLFRGPPGTGKTSTARKIGKVFYDMGFLATAEVVDCSATDLIGQYVGHTGPKVQSLLDKALGRVLFVDEAYRLSQGNFAKEAMDELVDSVTKERYFCKMIIILAGYDDDINNLMSMNPGLTSRFPETIDFHSMSPQDCIALLIKSLQGFSGKLQANSKRRKLDLQKVEHPSDGLLTFLMESFQQLTTLSGWANARDVLTLSKAVWTRTIKTPQNLVVSEENVRAAINDMRSERSHRESAAPVATHDLNRLVQTQDSSQMPAPPKTTMTSAPTITQAPAPNKGEKEEVFVETQKEVRATDDEDVGRRFREVKRDVGVSDEVWEQLQEDKRKQEEEEREYERIREAHAKATDEDREKNVKRLIAEEERRRKAVEMQQKLQRLGCCPMKFEWLKQAGGYRCAGGSHRMSDSEISKAFG